MDYTDDSNVLKVVSVVKVIRVVKVLKVPKVPNDPKVPTNFTALKLPRNNCFSGRVNWGESAGIDMPEGVVGTGAAHYLVEMGAVGIGDEYLAKARAGYKLHYALHTCGVELVEYVVEQEQGAHPHVVAEKFVLGEAQGNGIGLALPL